MSNEHSLLHQPTWHTPTTTDAMKMLPNTHMFNEMLKNESLFPKDCVDLRLTRNGNQNGELPSTPISLSVRDANKINSLPPSALDIQARELTKCNSPLMKPTSPVLLSTSPGLMSINPGIMSGNPALMSANPGLMSASTGLLAASSGLVSATSALLSTSSGLKSVSPGLKAPSPSLKVGNVGHHSSSNLKGTSRSNSPGFKGCDSMGPVLKNDSTVPKPDSYLNLTKPMSPNIGTPLLPLLQTPPIEALKSQQKRANVRVDSILERLNPQQPEKPANIQELKSDEFILEKPQNFIADSVLTDKLVSVIVQPPGGSCDENSNSNSICNVRDEDTVSSNSNEDSLDGNKSRRKRKPCKTIRVSKDEDKLEDKLSAICEGSRESQKEALPSGTQMEKDPITIVGKMLEEESKIPERRRSSDDLEELLPAKTRRKTSSESETIDNIAAMVQDCLKEKKRIETLVPDKFMDIQNESVESVSVIKSKENCTLINTPTTITSSISSSSTTMTPAQKKATNTHFVEVENKLEEMFAGIEDVNDPIKNDVLVLDDSKFDDSLSKMDDSLVSKCEQEPLKDEIKQDEPVCSQAQENITVSSTTEGNRKKPISPKKAKRKAPSSRRSSDTTSLETTPKKKKTVKKSKSDIKPAKSKTKSKKGMVPAQKTLTAKVETVKDVYAYDSGSNASSSKSRGPYISIRGPRDSPLSVNVINTPINEDDGDRKTSKSKKFHDDSEYRHKVRSKGLHSSTLSNKYDAQTKDATWICVFCKRGPHASELTGEYL